MLAKLGNCAFQRCDVLVRAQQALLQEFAGVIGVLGFAPALDRCVVDGREVPADRPAAFSPADGGTLCESCARARDVTRLPAEARADLRRLLDPDSPLPTLDRLHSAAHHRLLARYVRFHVAEGARLPALEFWEEQGRDAR